MIPVLRDNLIFLAAVDFLTPGCGQRWCMAPGSHCSTSSGSGESIPGVESTAVTSSLPLSGPWGWFFGVIELCR